MFSDPAFVSGLKNRRISQNMMYKEGADLGFAVHMFVNRYQIPDCAYVLTIWSMRNLHMLKDGFTVVMPFMRLKIRYATLLS